MSLRFLVQDVTRDADGNVAVSFKKLLEKEWAEIAKTLQERFKKCGFNGEKYGGVSTVVGHLAEIAARALTGMPYQDVFHAVVNDDWGKEDLKLWGWRTQVKCCRNLDYLKYFPNVQQQQYPGYLSSTDLLLFAGYEGVEGRFKPNARGVPEKVGLNVTPETRVVFRDLAYTIDLPEDLPAERTGESMSIKLADFTVPPATEALFQSGLSGIWKEVPIAT